MAARIKMEINELFYYYVVMNFKTLREEIHRKIKERGWSVSHAEREVGLSPKALRYFLDGRTKNPKLETLTRFCQVFEINLVKGQQKVFEPFLDLSGDTFDSKIFLEAAQSLVKFIGSNPQIVDISPSQAFLAFQELYSYCHSKGIQEIDDNLAEIFFLKAFHKKY